MVFFFFTIREKKMDEGHFHLILFDFKESKKETAMQTIINY